MDVDYNEETTQLKIRRLSQIALKEHMNLFTHYFEEYFLWKGTERGRNDSFVYVFLVQEIYKCAVNFTETMNPISTY